MPFVEKLLNYDHAESKSHYLKLIVVTKSVFLNVLKPNFEEHCNSYLKNTTNHKIWRNLGAGKNANSEMYCIVVAGLQLLVFVAGCAMLKNAEVNKPRSRGFWTKKNRLSSDWTKWIPASPKQVAFFHKLLKFSPFTFINKKALWVPYLF